MKQPKGIPNPDVDVKIKLPLNIRKWRDKYDEKKKLKWTQIWRWCKSWFE